MAKSTTNNKTRFDFTKPPKREFDFTKDDEIDEGPSMLGSRPAKGKSWIWWILGLVVIVVIAFFCLKSCGNKSDGIDVGTTEEKSAITTPTEEQDNDELVVPNDDAHGPEASGDIEPESRNESSEEASQSQDVIKPSEPATNDQSQPTTPSTTKTSAETAGDIEIEALNVIRGDYGNAPVRYELLRQKGLDPQAIQNRVNELKREGVF